MANPPLYSESNGTYDKPQVQVQVQVQPPPPPPVVAVSLLQPRVAVALGIPKHWHHTLSACRLLSIVPPIVWGLRFALRFLVADILRSAQHHGSHSPTFTLRLTETALAIIWVCHLTSPNYTHTDRIVLSYICNADLTRSVAPRPTSPFSSPTASCPAGSSTIPRKPPSCVSSPLAAPLPT